MSIGPSPYRLILYKLAGIVIGGGVGAGIGLLLGQGTYMVAILALGMALGGGMLAGGTVSYLGWSICLCCIFGSAFPQFLEHNDFTEKWFPNPMRLVVSGAMGMGVGFFAGALLEILKNRKNPPKE